jgi:hypothetical protein
MFDEIKKIATELCLIGLNLYQIISDYFNDITVVQIMNVPISQ